MSSALLLVTAERSNAQITSITSSGIYDSVTVYCKVPVVADFNASISTSGSFIFTDSVLLNINYGDGSDTTYKTNIYGVSPSGYAYAFVHHTYSFAGTFTPRLIVTAPSGVSDTAYGRALTFTNTCATLNGALYMDTLSNCVKDPGESGLRWVPIVVINTAIPDTINAGYCDYKGDYSFSLLPGSYTVMPNYSYTAGAGIAKANPFINAACPTTGAYSLTVSGGGAYTKDFGYSCTTPTVLDATSNVSGGCFFPGDTTIVSVWAGTAAWYSFYSCVSAGLSTTLTVNLDPALTYVGSYYGAAPSISGSTLTYSLSSVSALSYFYAGIVVKTATTATIGDTIRITSYIAPIGSVTDPNLANNTHNYKKAVVSSYDPNIKEVYPAGYGTQGFIPKNTPLTYTIHFQNTGTAAAKNITVTDVIDPNLDINTIHMLGATHNATFFKDGSSIKFRFENINLPDSGSNYIGSMGSITFGIKQKKDLVAGSKMQNTAAIYFDYNDPVITNTTLNTIVIPTSIENVALGNDVASVYPNPANNTLNVKMEATKSFTVRMVDMLGRIAMTQNTENGEMSINTSSITNGLYILSISDKEGNQTNKKVQVKH